MITVCVVTAGRPSPGLYFCDRSRCPTGQLREIGIEAHDREGAKAHVARAA